MQGHKHPLGAKVRSRVAGVEGIITSRSENLYGCNRYYIQPRADKDMKLPDGWWVDEDDIEVLEAAAIERKPKKTGGPMSRRS